MGVQVVFGARQQRPADFLPIPVIVFLAAAVDAAAATWQARISLSSHRALSPRSARHSSPTSCNPAHRKKLRGCSGRRRGGGTADGACGGRAYQSARRRGVVAQFSREAQ